MITLKGPNGNGQPTKMTYAHAATIRDFDPPEIDEIRRVRGLEPL